VGESRLTRATRFFRRRKIAHSERFTTAVVFSEKAIAGPRATDELRNRQTMAGRAFDLQLGRCDMTATWFEKDNAFKWLEMVARIHNPWVASNALLASIEWH
jgi:hypothetical protein